MLNARESDDLHRIADALCRLADKYAPTVKKEHKPAIIRTAAYSEEERERLKLRETLKNQAQKQA